MAEPRFNVYQNKAEEWRWRFIASNGKIIADSGEGYHNRADCVHGIELIKREAPEAEIE